MSDISPLDRFEGCLLGLACGDAVGTTVEFSARGRFEPLTDMVGGGVFGLEPGQWTDDTSMALCLADSLIACEGFDPGDQMERYCRWRDEGYNSSRDDTFDIGNTVASALALFCENGTPYAGSNNPNSAGNGSLMRLAPVPMYYATDSDTARQMAIDCSRTTHGAEECLAACEYFTALLVACFQGVVNKETLIQSGQSVELPKSMSHIGEARYRQKAADTITGSGYVVESLEASLWAFWHTDNFRDAILAAANLGDDADTTAAICGQIAGAFYGIEGIPKEWLEKLYRSQDIQKIAGQLYQATA